MKIKLFLFCFILSVTTYAQIINFQDLNFKNILLQSKIDFNDQNANPIIDYPFIDVNNDGEISQQEALLVNRLDLGYTEISNLSGLGYFVNLKSFNSLFFAANQFYFPTLVNLENLICTNAVTGIGSITNLDLSSNVNLKNVSFNTVATNLSLTNLSQLKNLSISGNFNQIDLTDCENLLNLVLNAPIETLDLNFNDKLISVYITNADFTSLDLSSCANLEIVSITNGEMQEIDLGTIQHIYYLFLYDNKLTSLNTNYLFNLQVLLIYNNLLTDLSVKNGVIENQISISGNSSLTNICCDANEIVYIQNLCNNLDYQTTISDCDFIDNSKFSISMYPNPVNDRLHINCNEAINKIEIFSCNGFLVNSFEGNTDLLNVSNLQSGMYFLKVYTKKDVSIMKLIKGN
jgi:hypothetical protein